MSVIRPCLYISRKRKECAVKIFVIVMNNVTQRCCRRKMLKMNKKISLITVHAVREYEAVKLGEM